MTLSRLQLWLASWWPTPIAATVALSMLLSGMFDDALQLVAMLTVVGALSLSARLPLAALAAASLGGLLAAVTSPAYSWWLLVVALGAVLVASWRLTPMRIRLLSGIVLGVLVAVVLALFSSARELWLAGAFQNIEGTVVWTVVMALWAGVVGARSLWDAARAESAKQQAVARTTVVESELRDERLRADLTHDFHDVMAHSLAVLAAQAEGLRLSHRQHPERIDPVLTTISDTARLALVEVRQLLERVDDDARRPQPTSADIPGLVAQLRSAGPSVVLHDIGTHGHLSRLADIAAYRIVQESLTNALRHGGSDIEVTVGLTWTGPGLTLAVSSPIHDRTALRPAGRGIAGMHERARIAGGSLEIDTAGDRFVVSAHLPYEPVSDAPTAPLSEDQLATLPVPLQPRPEDVVAPWIVEATRRYQERHPPEPTDDWSQATTVDLTPPPSPDGHIPNPMAPREQA
ncbi:MAG: histidine kinase [Agrococcus sp.]